jgi:hypothetical protein
MVRLRILFANFLASPSPGHREDPCRPKELTYCAQQPHADSSYFMPDSSKADIYEQLLLSTQGLLDGQRNWVRWVTQFKPCALRERLKAWSLTTYQQPIQRRFPPMARIRLPSRPLVICQLGRILHPWWQIPSPCLPSLLAANPWCTQLRWCDHLNYILFLGGSPSSPRTIPRKARMPGDSLRQRRLWYCCREAGNCYCSWCSDLPWAHRMRRGESQWDCRAYLG